MRLKIEFEGNDFRVPINYQSVLQGVIYNIFDREAYGKFLHEKGYQNEKKVYKLFTFSNLFGSYEIDKNTMIFKEKVFFYIGSQSEEFMRIVYEFLSKNSLLNLYHQMVRIEKLEFCDVKYFSGEKELVIKTLSPVVAYRTNDNYVTYYKPEDSEFYEICLQNIMDKNAALDHVIPKISFKILDVLYQKKRLVRFKNTFYESYMCEFKICVNYETLMLIYNTGLSSKGSAGFGMIDIVK